MRKALLIEFNVTTGKRAGDISPKDPGLFCRGWQDLDSIPAREIRLVEDARDISQYEGIPGVTILNNEAEINQVIDQVKPPWHVIENETLFLEDLRQRNIKLSDFEGWSPEAILDELNKRHVVGIRKNLPMKV